MSIVIVGAGPNLGAAIARRFGREGMPIGLISRNHDKLEQLAAELTEAGITADFERNPTLPPGSSLRSSAPFAARRVTVLATVVRAMPVASAISRAVDPGRSLTVARIASRFAPRRARALDARRLRLRIRMPRDCVACGL